MRILLIGYGKMGQAIAQVVWQRGHQIIDKIDRHNQEKLAEIDPATVDVALEFSTPIAAYHNIYTCLTKNIPVVSGTTGWLSKKEDIDAYCKACHGTFFHATNFSIGMNLLFKLNTYLARIMNHYAAYEVTITEEHHCEKKDAPSGTSITLAEGIMEHLHRKNRWTLMPAQSDSDLRILVSRQGDISGTHKVTYTTPLDTLCLTHVAHDRAAFALGAVLVAEWIQDKQGILGMEDFLALANCV